MPDKPKPLTKAEWEDKRAYWCSCSTSPLDKRIAATLDALFAYRERTRGIWFGTVPECTDDIAAELRIE